MLKSKCLLCDAIASKKIMNRTTILHTCPSYLVEYKGEDIKWPFFTVVIFWMNRITAFYFID